MKTAVTLLVFCVSSLLALGMVMLYSAGFSLKLGAAHVFVIKQLIALGIGLALCVVMALLDYRFLKKIAWVLFGITVVLLGWVLTMKASNGARRWFELPGGFSFQPSELAKIALILVVAWYGEKHQRFMPTFVRGVLVPGLIVGLVVGLVIVEPDVGTAILLGAVSCVMLLLAGMRWRYFLPPALVAGAALTVFLMHNDVRSGRIHAWLHPVETKLGKGMQAWEARVAFGAGGWAGRGLGSSRQKFGFVPEHHTDFIFPIIGEELGLPATLGVVTAYILLMWAGFVVAVRAPDLFGLFAGAGITFLIGVQAFVNIAVVTSVFPNKGLPLPFISYGGSNLILMLGCVGVLLSIARRGSEVAEPDEEPLPAGAALTTQLS